MRRSQNIQMKLKIKAYKKAFGNMDPNEREKINGVASHNHFAQKRKMNSTIEESADSEKIFDIVSLNNSVILKNRAHLLTDYNSVENSSTFLKVKRLEDIGD